MRINANIFFIKNIFFSKILSLNRQTCIKKHEKYIKFTFYISSGVTVAWETF